MKRDMLQVVFWLEAIAILGTLGYKAGYRIGEVLGAKAAEK